MILSKESVACLYKRSQTFSQSKTMNNKGDCCKWTEYDRSAPCYIHFKKNKLLAIYPKFIKNKPSSSKKIPFKTVPERLQTKDGAAIKEKTF